MIFVGLGLVVMLFAIDARARGSSTTQSASVHSPSIRTHASASVGFQGGFDRMGYRGGLAKSAARGNTSGWSGYRGNGNYYHSGNSHRYYRGNYGRRSYWPYRSIGTYFTYLPDYYTTVYVDGSPYYYCDGYYFSPYSNGGYVIVPEPVSTVASQEPEAIVQSSPSETDEQPIAPQSKASHDTVTINVPNSKGGFTPVRLVKNKNGYIGPQGEFYAKHPTVTALKALYGD